MLKFNKRGENIIFLLTMEHEKYPYAHFHLFISTITTFAALFTDWSGFALLVVLFFGLYVWNFARRGLVKYFLFPSPYFRFSRRSKNLCIVGHFDFVSLYFVWSEGLSLCVLSYHWTAGRINSDWTESEECWVMLTLYS